MRRDLHIGLAIGGVLLAVLVVWGMVVNHSHKRSEVTLDKNMPGSTGGSEVPPPTDGSTPQVAQPADSGSTTITPPASSGSPADSQSGTASPAPVAPQPTVQPPTAVPASANPGATPVAATGEKKSIDWDSLLNHNAPIPTLGATSTTDSKITTSAGDNSSNATNVTPVANTTTPAPKPIEATPLKLSSVVDSTASPLIDSPTPTPTPSAEEKHLKTHTVVSGESFASISRAVYGSPRYYDQIAQANPKIDPNRLRPGTVINLPDPADIKALNKPSKTSESASAKHKASDTATAAPDSQAGIDPQKEYRIASGDSLYKISVRLYGSGEEVDHLYELNKDAIGPDKSKLKVGMVIKIPAPATVASAH